MKNIMEKTGIEEVRSISKDVEEGMEEHEGGGTESDSFIKSKPIQSKPSSENGTRHGEEILSMR